MGVRSKAGKLFLDFRWRGRRCREFTGLDDTKDDRRRAEAFLKVMQGPSTRAHALARARIFFRAGARAWARAGMRMKGWRRGEVNPFVQAPGCANERVFNNIANGVCSDLPAVALAIGPGGLFCVSSEPRRG